MRLWSGTHRVLGEDQWGQQWWWRQSVLEQQDISKFDFWAGLQSSILGPPSLISSGSSKFDIRDFDFWILTSRFDFWNLFSTRVWNNVSFPTGLQGFKVYRLSTPVHHTESTGTSQTDWSDWSDWPLPWMSWQGHQQMAKQTWHALCLLCHLLLADCSAWQAGLAGRFLGVIPDFWIFLPFRIQSVFKV